MTVRRDAQLLARWLRSAKPELDPNERALVDRYDPPSTMKESVQEWLERMKEPVFTLGATDE